MLLLVITWGCDDIIEIEDISGDVVSVLAPADASVLSITEINFSWNAVEDAEQYKLQVATPTFESATQVVLDTTITATNFTETLSTGAYQWRVRAENSGFQTGYTTQSFTVE